MEGEVKNLNSRELINSINRVLKPRPIFSYISFSIPPQKFLLFHNLTSQIPEKLCSSTPSCFSWKYEPELYEVEFNISNEIYYYDLFDVLTDLEKNGFLYSPIVNQTTLIIKYNPVRDAIEVIA